MLARVQSFVLTGVDAGLCEVEVDLQESEIRREQIVGLPDAAVRETIERVRSAIQNAGYVFPSGRLLVNLAPAEVRKEGPAYDLPVAIGLLAGQGVVRPPREGPPPQIQRRLDAIARIGARATVGAGGGGDSPDDLPESELGLDLDERLSRASHALGENVELRSLLLAGELALDGRVRPVKGVVAMAILASRMGLRGVVVPAENAAEAAAVAGVEVYGVRTLSEVVGLLNGALRIPPHPEVDVAAMIRQSPAPIDFADVRGQEGVKRALLIAASGGHNILMMGPAGTGKTMMAKALPGILPPLSPEEALEITRIYSAAGQFARRSDAATGDVEPRVGLVTSRPVRSPHHTISTAALVGGGVTPRPGEVSLAHHGVLFLDELPEFTTHALETLRQPLEDDVVTIARAHSAVRFPASFMLVAAMNPTRKGPMPSDNQGKREMKSYLSRLSGPLVDRIDIHVEAPAVPWKELQDSTRRGVSSAQLRDRVLGARQRQRDRQGMTLNARLRGRELDSIAPLTDEARCLLGQAITDLGLSARAYDKVRRVARTIADLAGDSVIDLAHVAEAVQYRLLDRRV